jgi:hypothetical protein
LFELLEQGHRPEKVLTSQHYLQTSTADCQIAQALAQRVDVVHEVVFLRSPVFRYECVKNIATDFSVLEHAWAVELARRLSKYRTVYDGLNGGVLFGRSAHLHARYDLFANGKFAELGRHFVSANETSLLAVLNSSFYKRIPLHLAVAEICDELRKYSEFANPIQAFNYFNRVRRSTSLYSFNMLNVENTYCPLDDMDVVDFALSMPVELTLDSKLQEDALSRAFPQFSDVPFDADLSPGLVDTSGFRRYDLDILMSCLKPSRHKICNRAFIFSRSAAALLSRDPARISWWANLGAYFLQLEDYLHRHGPALRTH